MLKFIELSRVSAVYWTTTSAMSLQQTNIHTYICMYIYAYQLIPLDSWLHNVRQMDWGTGYSDGYQRPGCNALRGLLRQLEAAAHSRMPRDRLANPNPVQRCWHFRVFFFFFRLTTLYWSYTGPLTVTQNPPADRPTVLHTNRMCLVLSFRSPFKFLVV